MYIYHAHSSRKYVDTSLGIPKLGWIDDMLGMTQIQFKEGGDEQQFQSAMKAMVVTTWVLFLAGYFLGTLKCNLIPEQVMTYLGIECDSHRIRFLVPQERKEKYIDEVKGVFHQPLVI